MQSPGLKLGWFSKASNYEAGTSALMFAFATLLVITPLRLMFAIVYDATFAGDTVEWQAVFLLTLGLPFVGFIMGGIHPARRIRQFTMLMLLSRALLVLPFEPTVMIGSVATVAIYMILLPSFITTREGTDGWAVFAAGWALALLFDLALGVLGSTVDPTVEMYGFPAARAVVWAHYAWGAILLLIPTLLVVSLYDKDSKVDEDELSDPAPEEKPEKGTPLDWVFGGASFGLHFFLFIAFLAAPIVQARWLDGGVPLYATGLTVVAMFVTALLCLDGRFVQWMHRLPLPFVALGAAVVAGLAFAAGSVLGTPWIGMLMILVMFPFFTFTMWAGTSPLGRWPLPQRSLGLGLGMLLFLGCSLAMSPALDLGMSPILVLTTIIIATAASSLWALVGPGRVPIATDSDKDRSGSIGNRIWFTGGGQRQWLTVWVVLAFLLAGIAAMFTPIGFTESPPDELDVMTYNLHGGYSLNGSLDITDVVEVIENATNGTPDVLALQEVGTTSMFTGRYDITQVIAERFNYHVYYGHPGSSGLEATPILSKYPFAETSAEDLCPECTDDHVASTAEIRLDANRKVLVINVHFPSEPEQAAIVALQDLIRDDIPVIVLGDFNFEDGSSLYSDLLTESGTPLDDAWKELNPSGSTVNERVGYTFPSMNATTRADYIFYSDRDMEVVECVPLEVFSSDHRPVIATLDLD